MFRDRRIEGKKKYLNQKIGKEEKIKMKVEVNLEFLKMEKYLIKLVLIIQRFMENFQKNLKIKFQEQIKIQNFGRLGYLLLCI